MARSGRLTPPQNKFHPNSAPKIGSPQIVPGRSGIRVGLRAGWSLSKSCGPRVSPRCFARYSAVRLIQTSSRNVRLAPLGRARFHSKEVQAIPSPLCRKQSLSLCREVLPGRPVQLKLVKSDRQPLLQSLTGVDPLRCEVCGQRSLHLAGTDTASGAEGSAVTMYLVMA